MYLLLSRIPAGLDPLRERFEKHVKKAGLESVERCVGSVATEANGGGKNGAANEDASGATDPKAYVDSLLAVHKKNGELVGKAFRGDQTFVASLDRVRSTSSNSLSVVKR
jgi:cullin 1